MSGAAAHTILSHLAWLIVGNQVTAHITKWQNTLFHTITAPHTTITIQFIHVVAAVVVFFCGSVGSTVCVEHEWELLELQGWAWVLYGGSLHHWCSVSNKSKWEHLNWFTTHGLVRLSWTFNMGLHHALVNTCFFCVCLNALIQIQMHTNAPEIIIKKTTSWTIWSR